MADYPFRSRTDSEVILAAFQKWGPACLDRLVGMFAFAIWDEQEQSLFGARDRFGVKPLYYADVDGSRLVVASEIKALHAAGVAASRGHDGVGHLPGARLPRRLGADFLAGRAVDPSGSCIRLAPAGPEDLAWYDLAEAVGEPFDGRSEAEVSDEYLQLLRESVRLRFRADVPVGINLSGGLDSSILLALVRELQGPDSHVKAFTFATGDSRYDETPWVEQMLDQTHHPLTVCTLSSAEVPALADTGAGQRRTSRSAGCPRWPTRASSSGREQEGVIVLLDGQGMDEQWAGYDYYRSLGAGGNLDAAARLR